MDELDQTDIQILRLLQEDGRIAHAELAHRVGLTPPSVQRRVRLLEERGYIKCYTAVIDPLKLNLPVAAFIFIETAAGCNLRQVEGFLTRLPGVQELHRLIGEWCFLIKVRTYTPQTLETLIYEVLRQNPNVRRTHTVLATSSPYETTLLPLPEVQEVDHERQSLF